MRFFYFIAIFFLIDFIWWLLADRLARRTANPRPWRRAVAAWAIITIVGLSLLLVARMLRMRAMIMPEIAVIAVFLWHFLIAPASIVASAAFVLIGRRREAEVAPPVELVTVASPPPPVVGLSRRDFLYGGLAVLPPVATIGMTAESKWAEDHLLRRDFDVPIKNLPAALEGMTIAHVADPHIGSFITDRKIRRIIEMTNEMDADLVLQTGDLINQKLSDLPDGIDMLRQLRGRYGVFSCQGNHDCIDDRQQFEDDMKAAGLNLLVDESRLLDVRGHRLRLLGPRWWGGKDDVIAWSVNQLLPKTADDAFNVLMIHHPHGFDAAVAAGIPLTLAGHTHGGQIALTKDIGVGPMMYRYWSGIYQKQNSTAVISNGTGNWFPLRINVPCEILKLTLRRA